MADWILIRNILEVGNLSTFERFVKLVAIRTGQILNLSDLARDTGISVPTATKWLSVLESSYLVFKLPSFHANLSKRLVKAPKIYFGDTALATYLMGIQSLESLNGSPNFGALFETAVFLEHMKESSQLHQTLSFFRTQDGCEVDLLIEKDGELAGFEIKIADLTD